MQPVNQDSLSSLEPASSGSLPLPATARPEIGGVGEFEGRKADIIVTSEPKTEEIRRNWKDILAERVRDQLDKIEFVAKAIGQVLRNLVDKVKNASFLFFKNEEKELTLEEVPISENKNQLEEIAQRRETRKKVEELDEFKSNIVLNSDDLDVLSNTTSKTGTQAARELLQNQESAQFDKDFDRTDIKWENVPKDQIIAKLSEHFKAGFNNLKALMVQSIVADANTELAMYKISGESLPTPYTTASPVSFEIQEQGNNVILTAKCIFSKFGPTQDGEKEFFDFCTLTRQLTFSREDLNHNWSNTQDLEKVATSLKNIDNYSMEEVNLEEEILKKRGLPTLDETKEYKIIDNNKIATVYKTKERTTKVK